MEGNGKVEERKGRKGARGCEAGKREREPGRIGGSEVRKEGDREERAE